MKNKKLMLISISILVLIALGSLFIKSSENNQKTVNRVTKFSLESTGSTEPGDVLIELIPQTANDGKLIIKSKVNTHSVDLTPFDLTKIVTLESEGKSYKPISAPKLSGHHVSGDIVFQIEKKLTDFTIKIIDIPAEQERLFKWNSQNKEVVNTPKKAALDTPSLEIIPITKDLGDVSQAKGIITTDFTVKNIGEGDLIFNDMETSCMCTSAKLITKKETSPVFGMKMHGNPKGWKAILKTGEEATLRVIYDPNVHGELRGSITRVIELYSNDPNKEKVQVKIKLNQVA